MRFSYLLFLAATLLHSVAFGFSQEGLLPIPYKPDPPFAMDGDLGDWGQVRPVFEIHQNSQAVWGATAWEGANDLSGTIRLAWRYDALYLAAEVVDDALQQPFSGASLWQGDNVQLFLDLRPGIDSSRDSFGEGQFQIAVSPGNFQHTADPLFNTVPEVFCYKPAGHVLAAARAAALPTERGYTIEAILPWADLGLESPTAGVSLRFEVGLSDSDADDPRQDTLMTLGTDAWSITRARLHPASLAGADGALAVESPSIPIQTDGTLQAGESVEYSFSLEALPEGREAVVTLLARIEYDRVAGYNPALRVHLNGTALDIDRLLNKPLRVRARGGDVYSMAAGDRLSAFYSPDYTSPDTDPHYGLLGDISACTFVLRGTDLLHPGINTAAIEYAPGGGITNPLHFADLKVEFRAPQETVHAPTGPPEGPLSRIVPSSDFTPPYEVEQLPGATLAVSIGGESFTVSSEFSTPAPAWVSESNAHFSHSRRIDKTPEAVLVFDTFTNLGNENLPLMHRHQWTGKADEVRLGGLIQAQGSGTATTPENPTTFLAHAGAALGLLPMDDVFRVHILNFAAESGSGIADRSLVIPPGDVYTAEWAILPSNTPDYWDFINATRRLLGANFTIDGGFAFFRNGPLTEVWTDEQTEDFIRFKDAKYLCASIDYPRYLGRYTHGTAFQRVDHDSYRATFERRRRLVPESKQLVYFHCFIDVIDEGPVLFFDARTLRPDGAQADYGIPEDRLYLPLATNSFGPAIAKNVDIILDEIGADGVYWDEHEYSSSMYHYGEPWDECSGDIDPRTLTLSRLKSSVTLLSESWRVALAKKILARGPLIGNGAPFTRAMAALQFPCFIETGSVTHCTRGHLHSPIALGDHLTERNEKDAYATMLAALDYGCVYHWYNDVTVVPTHPHLTRHMYPITPMELHEGYLIGEERIVTKKSGLFGWGDASRHVVHAFNAEGREDANFQAPFIEEVGQTFTELRLAEGWSAVIVRGTVSSPAN